MILSRIIIHVQHMLFQLIRHESEIISFNLTLCYINIKIIYNLKIYDYSYLKDAALGRLYCSA